MRRGRPTSHTKAKWITYSSEGTEKYYELDEKGRIIKEGRNISPHHTLPFEQQNKVITTPKLIREEKEFIPRVILPFFNMVTFQKFPNPFKEPIVNDVNNAEMEPSSPISFEQSQILV
ncbi:hypothetical protein TVAG_123090 [Trichomonas vaginalis G3]|uniref:Uncharacterized protein n=1 Tax=Trichomonas vaginalis (strain ATCC PRA-98 / G3) TaxID=412133 RepID=A2FH80_TRIV3|nr:hypothetical protein TVAGG3_0181530 [Trichomonas vaginalis G3]EAX95718.1 hypothetical protein TVAG_123090 [Trichomonas vaginalis G3]KAI5549323.1 hypothetical protein TVAGG3_0181530 [Trichomonas vaginalis G3]|eukprot:XP_001308648.1 hypothetical protein [Trichomonas vaginalis G3]